jgi:RNA polymerase sigma-70 factor, ECF subfamily
MRGLVRVLVFHQNQNFYPADALVSLRANGVEFGNFHMDYTSLQPEELARVCAQTGEASAWEEFIRRFNPLITRVVFRTARRWGELSLPVLDDLIQETYLKLCADNCRLLRTFESRQPEAIYGYLKVVTANVVHDHFKASFAAKRGSGETPDDIDVTDVSSSPPSSSDQASIERAVLLGEIDQHLARLVPAEDLPRSRLIFWLYYRSGLSARAIASIPSVGLTTKGVESALSRLTRLIRTACSEPTTAPKENGQDSLQDRKEFPRAESF